VKQLGSLIAVVKVYSAIDAAFLKHKQLCLCGSGSAAPFLKLFALAPHPGQLGQRPALRWLGWFFCRIIRFKRMANPKRGQSHRSARHAE
jgi:hypothetical protein